MKEDLVKELNTLLRSNKLDLPDFRREVSKSGKNVQWLISNIKKRNLKYNIRIDELLDELSRL